MWMNVQVFSELYSRDNAGYKPADGAFGVENPSRALLRKGEDCGRAELKTPNEHCYKKVKTVGERLIINFLYCIV
jgi:hypothetical protein